MTDQQRIKVIVVLEVLIELMAFGFKMFVVSSS